MRDHNLHYCLLFEFVYTSVYVPRICSHWPVCMFTGAYYLWYYLYTIAESCVHRASYSHVHVAPIKFLDISTNVHLPTVIEAPAATYILRAISTSVMLSRNSAKFLTSSKLIPTYNHTDKQKNIHNHQGYKGSTTQRGQPNSQRKSRGVSEYIICIHQN